MSEGRSTGAAWVTVLVPTDPLLSDPSCPAHPDNFFIGNHRRDELRNEDVALRLNSVRRLSTIALALGEERTRRELIPFLLENTDDEDEVLLVVAEELGKFVPLVGGPQHAHFLLTPLESLASVDETVVRDKAAESLRVVGDALPDASIASQFVPLLERLLGREWTSRVSASQLFATAYPRAPKDTRAKLRSWFGGLCKDETPMVRRAAAQAFGSYVEVVEPDVVGTELLPMFLQLTEDGETDGCIPASCWQHSQR